MIDNRPKILFDLLGYSQLPQYPFTIDYENLPDLLKHDMFSLYGIQPIIEPIMKIYPNLTANPSEKEIEYYRKHNTQFQIVHVVVNLHSFILKGNVAYGQPYSICIVPGLKRNKPDVANIDTLVQFDLEKISEDRTIYTDFNPFEGVYGGFWGKAELLLEPNQEIFLDTIGFVTETYFLNINHDPNDILIPGVNIPNERLNKKYWKLREKKYYKPFTNKQPRRVWGADSPIELFLIQNLARHSVYPKIQTSIYKDGSIFPHYYDVLTQNWPPNGMDLITDADLYFPDKKIAVFCDSKKHHRSKKTKLKDQRIAKELENIGITSIRINGKTIVEEIEAATDKILKALI